MSDHIPSRGPQDGHTPDTATSAPRATATPSWVQMSPTPLQAALSGIGQDHVGPATTVWPTGQNSDAGQRTGRYLRQTTSHPRRTRPALAAHAIRRYSQPGPTVFDAFVGTGTTVVEAVYAGRQAIGVDIDPRWVELTSRDLAYAHQHGATGSGMILRHGGCAAASTWSWPPHRSGCTRRAIPPAGGATPTWSASWRST